MNVQTAISNPAQSRPDNKPGSVSRGQDGNDGFETTLRNTSEKGSEDSAVAERDSEMDGPLSRGIAALAGSKPIDLSAGRPPSAQTRPENRDAESDDLPLPDPAERTDASAPPLQRTEHQPVSAIQNWAHRLNGLNGPDEAGSMKPPAREFAATVGPDGPSQLTHRADMKEPVPGRRVQTAGATDLQAAHVSITGMRSADNTEARIGSAGPLPAAPGKSLERTESLIKKADAISHAAVERVPAGANPIGNSIVAEARATSLNDRFAQTHRTEAAAANPLPAGQTGALVQQEAAMAPAPSVPFAAASDGGARANPATGSLLSQLEQVEAVRELASTDRAGFISRLTQNGGSVQVLRLQLKPAELGTVTANMRMENGQMTVELVAEKDAAFRQLSKDISIMQTAMRSMGIVVDEIVVSHGGSGSDGHQTADGQQRGTSESRGESGFGRRPGQQSNDGEITNETGRNTTNDGKDAASSGIYI